MESTVFYEYKSDGSFLHGVSGVQKGTKSRGACFLFKNDILYR